MFFFSVVGGFVKIYFFKSVVELNIICGENDKIFVLGMLFEFLWISSILFSEVMM